MASSSEALTKFLRNKNTSVDDIYETSIKLLSNNNPSFVLPQIERFLLELVADRLSQKNTFTSKFKSNINFWKLINFIWGYCSDNSELVTIRTKIFSKLKVGEIFINIFSEIDDNDQFEDNEFISEFIKFMLNITTCGNISLSQDQNISIIKDLTQALVTHDYPEDLINMTSKVICHIFRIGNTSSVKYDTKHIKEFTTFCIPNILIIIHRKITSTSLKNALEQTIRQSMLRDDMASNILEFTEFFINSPSISILESNEAVFLLELIIPQVKMDTLESIYKLMIESMPLASGELLKQITSMNKTLSTEFLSELVTKEFNTTSPRTVVITEAIKRNADVGIKFSKEIIEYSIKTKNIKLAKSLFDSYILSRNLENFVELWQNYDKDVTTTVCSDEFSDYVSLKLVSLSLTQLINIVQTEVQYYKNNMDVYPIALISICKGLLKGVEGSIQNAVSKTLLQNLEKLSTTLISLLSLEAKYINSLRFYILLLFDIEVITNHTNISKILLDTFVHDEYFYYCYFRTVEQDIELIEPSIQKSFMKYFTKSSHEFRDHIFSRWIMLLNVIFEKEDIQILIDNLFSLDDHQIQSIINYSLAQEQHKIMEAFVNHILKHNKLLFFDSISLYLLKKKQRVIVLNKLTDELINNNENKSKYINILLKLLNFPTFKSNIENNLATLIKFVQNNIENELFSKVIILILQNHINNKELSNNYIINCFKELPKLLQQSTQKSNTLPIAVALVQQTLEQNISLYKEESLNLINNIIGCIFELQSNVSNVELCALLDYVSRIGKFVNNTEKIKELVTQCSVANENDILINQKLFKIVTSLQGSYHTSYLVALYLALGDVNNFEHMSKFIFSLPQEEYIKIWQNISYSAYIDSKSSSHLYINLLSMFILHCEKPKDLLDIQKVFVESISFVASNVTNLDEKNVDSIMNFLNTIKVCASTKNWLFTQYSFELLFALISNFSDFLRTEGISFLTVENFVNITQTLSSFILYQRFRLSQRYHLVVFSFSSLLNLLMSRSEKLDKAGGLAYERLISNLCEPSNTVSLTGNNVEFNGDDNYVSKDMKASNTLSNLKSYLRKHLHILLFSYIKFYLKYMLEISVKKHLDVSMFMILDLFTVGELNIVNKSLDHQGRVVFKALYEDYKKYYKWKEE